MSPANWRQRVGAASAEVSAKGSEMSAKPYSVASVLAGIGMTVPPYCRCGAPVRRPADRCETCRDAESAERRAAMIRTRVESRVPAAFRWGALGEGTDLHRAMAQPHLMRDIVEWLAGPSSPPVLLLRGGETKALKSSVAGACVRHETEAGRESFFVLAVDLAPLGERPEESQREARSLALRRVNNTRALVVLDDISKVFGAPRPTPEWPPTAEQTLCRRFIADVAPVLAPSSQLTWRIGPGSAVRAKGEAESTALYAPRARDSAR